MRLLSSMSYAERVSAEWHQVKYKLARLLVSKVLGRTAFSQRELHQTMEQMIQRDPALTNATRATAGRCFLTLAIVHLCTVRAHSVKLRQRCACVRTHG